ncbi:unnamed protein product [Linum tenue]|uniref:Nodule Cysteine-Rich (NCR) secreted peptide n=1 Tax=Linum tenue TaxID=586396 RepID=A0AAV0IH11_9ROSI|nr:unnamed protein product [Linum tenue]
MEKANFKLVFCVMILVLAISGGEKNNIGVEGGRTSLEWHEELHCVSRPCKSDADCNPSSHYVCNKALGVCVCS